MAMGTRHMAALVAARGDGSRQAIARWIMPAGRVGAHSAAAWSNDHRIAGPEQIGGAVAVQADVALAGARTAAGPAS